MKSHCIGMERCNFGIKVFGKWATPSYLKSGSENVTYRLLVDIG